jgi:mannose-6-phosphate isomerase-like protein (cupin superfamily)
MSEQGTYSINLDTRFAPLELIDVKAIADAQQPWWNQTLTQVNDCVVRLGVVHGEFHWHKHDEEDEFFYVLEGQFIIELEGQTVELNPGQGFTVPRGVMHFPRAPVRTVILMVEGSGVIPTGD